MNIRDKFPDAVIQKALVLRRRGLTYRDISERLAETMTDAPDWSTVRNWITGRSPRAARLAMRLAA